MSIHVNGVLYAIGARFIDPDPPTGHGDVLSDFGRHVQHKKTYKNMTSTRHDELAGSSLAYTPFRTLRHRKQLMM